MAASGDQPVSAQNLAAALGVERSGGIGSQPVSVDNLKAALSEMGGGKVLYSGTPAQSVVLSEDPTVYDALVIVAVQNNEHFTFASTNKPYQQVPFLMEGVETTIRGDWVSSPSYSSAAIIVTRSGLTLTSKAYIQRITLVIGINFTT